jgi:hypothetical protein
MAPPPEHVQAILDLEARHDELFELLADLEKRVAGVLAQYQSGRPDLAAASPVQITPAVCRPPRAVAA